MAGSSARTARRARAPTVSSPRCAPGRHPGDIVENGTAQEFRDTAVAMNPILDRVPPVVGNHETKDAANKLAQSYFAFLGVRRARQGRATTPRPSVTTWAGVFMNSEWGLAEQAAWLAAVLPTFADRHVFAVLHTP